MALTSVDKVKRYTPVEASDLNMDEAQFDVLIDDLIADYTDRIERFTDRTFSQHGATGAEDVQTYSVGATDRRIIHIKGPVISISKVETRGDKTDSWAELSSNYWMYENINNYVDIAKLLRTGQGPSPMRNRYISPYTTYQSTQNMTWRSRWIAGYENLRVTGIWGFATVPVEIEMICRRLIDMELHGRVRSDNERIMTLENIKSDRPMVLGEMPDEIQKQLRRWVSRVAMGGVV